MNKLDNVVEIPYGTRDYLPTEAKRKRSMENSLYRLFSAWGYCEVVTPTYEYLDILQKGSGNDLFQATMKFFDKNNKTLALRSDMTTPIARLAVTRLADDSYPLRLCYLTNVFRYELAQAGRQCEFFQGGVELLGIAEPSADAEVIALAVQTMRDAGLKSFQISLGQVDFINGIMRQAGISLDEQLKIKQLILKRDLVGLDAFLFASAMTPGEQEVVRNIPRLYGKRDVLHRAYDLVTNDESRQALQNLEDIYDLLTSYQVEDDITFDLGLIRDFNYYTGMVFEGYTPGLGFPVCGGGRYNNLLASFGTNCPATGFAVGVDRLLLALDRQGVKQVFEDKGVYVSWQDGSRDEAVRTATRLREQGLSVEVSLRSETKLQAEEVCRQKRCVRFIYCEKS